MTNKRIILTIGDWIKLSDIPNEQVFNLVKKCFINAGFTDHNGYYARYNDQDKHLWKTLLITDNETHCYGQIDSETNNRQLSLSDVFNSVNGGFDWYGLNHVTITKDAVSCWHAQVVIDQGDLSAYTIKRIHDAPEAPEAIIQPKVSQWWDYEKGGAVELPPVDTWCQYSLSNGRTWFKCKVISHDKLVLDCPHVEDENGNGLQIVNKNAVMFRPLDYKTPKQIAVDNAFACLSEFRSAQQVLGELYDKGLLKGGE